MKKVLLIVIFMFIFLGDASALVIDCPKVVSPGEEVKIKIQGDGINGFKAKYDVNSSFVYKNAYIDLPWKSYYNGGNGIAVGNVVDNKGLDIGVSFMVDINVLVNKSYSFKFTEIETSDNNNKVSIRNDLSCDIKVLSNINTLDSLSVEGVNLSPKFSKDVTSYRGVTNKDKIIIKASASDEGSVIEGDIGEKKLNIGTNVFVVKVKSARGEYREYKLYIVREVLKKNDDVTLKSLTLSSGKLDFKKDTFWYSVDVSNEIDSIDIKAVPNDSKASVEVIKDDKLIVGENIIKINVKAENGDMGSYVVVVNRLKLLSRDASIKELKIKNYDIDFKSDVFDYYLDIIDEESLDIEVILNDSNAKYKILGNNKLVNNSIIEIEVTAENGDILVYKIKVGIEGESNSNSIFSYLGIWPITLFIISIGSILVIKFVRGKVIRK